MDRDFSSVAFDAGVLGALFYRDPASEEGRPTFRWVCSDGASGAWTSGQPGASDLIVEMGSAIGDEGEERLHKAYNRLFVGPFKLPAPPWGSVYLDPEQVIFGNETLELRDWMRGNGVELHLPDKEPEDHFGIMLSMFSFAAQSGVPDDQLEVFLSHHLLPWSGRFLELFEAGADDGFYSAAARLAKVTLDDWMERFGIEPEERKLYR